MRRWVPKRKGRLKGGVGFSTTCSRFPKQPPTPTRRLPPYRPMKTIELHRPRAPGTGLCPLLKEHVKERETPAPLSPCSPAPLKKPTSAPVHGLRRWFTERACLGLMADTMWTSARPRAGGWEPGGQKAYAPRRPRAIAARATKRYMYARWTRRPGPTTLERSAIFTAFRFVKLTILHKCRGAIGTSWPATDGCDDDKPTPCAPTRRKLWHQRSVHETAIGQHLY